MLVGREPADDVGFEWPIGLDVFQGQQTAVGDPAAVGGVVGDELSTHLGMDAITTYQEVGCGFSSVCEGDGDLVLGILRLVSDLVCLSSKTSKNGGFPP